MRFNKSKFKWMKTKQAAFDKINQTVVYDTLLTYPDFSKTFKIHTNARSFQSGAVIIQKVKSITFYNRKLTDSQQQYTSTEKELLSIFETLK